MLPRFASLKILFFSALSVLSTLGFSQALSTCDKADLILQMASDFHVNPRPVDSTLSRLTFNSFMESINSRESFLTAEDVAQLNKYKFTAALNGDEGCKLIQDASTIYANRLAALKNLLGELGEAELDFTTDESFNYPTSVMSEEEWTSYWKKTFQIRVLFTAFAQRDSGSTETPSKAEFGAYQKKVSESVICRMEDDVNHFENIESYIANKYLNALSQAFDPHTSFFTQESMKEFEMSLSRDAKSYGLNVYRNSNGDIEVYDIIPGSPAWRSNEINIGDIIVKVESSNESFDDFSCLPMSEVNRIIETGSSESGTFTFRKPSGEEIEVFLRKEVVEVKENTVQTFILDGDAKIGYIYLPSFYMGGADSYSPEGCARDVSLSLIRLKREGIDGLIFDLRNNGGGSMYEALRMAGIFVDYGALSIESAGEPPYQTLKDMDRGIIFDKPMVVMVNTFSASASELFAAALQDRNRAIIVGSQTYGKATIQQVLPLLDYRNGDTTIVPDNFIKLTLGAFYRVTGESHQAVGITPDILLPEFDDYSEYREDHYASVLDCPTINKKTYYFPSDPLPIARLKELSEGRLRASADWQQVGNHDEEENTSVPLGYAQFVALFEEVESLEIPFKDLSDNLPYSIDIPDFVLEINQEENERIKENLSEDPHIAESFLILNDYLQLISQ
ncbi:S41 family peptidase [Phaeocystidibacter luteus]|uniref:PDZ domain-containing protein n=1 Tax=Phaeocystidibacter luteus TaxID=911197 RepID=A0A6N6RG04_9FLAO|nr:S41 family peptidase [Phaeocystidibacter luteus]KAB2810070.1 hypothetical protein F8C67_07485 [Phaeocystidibacter luteus]